MSSHPEAAEDPRGAARIGELVARLTDVGGPAPLTAAERGRVLRSLTVALAASARAAGRASLLGGRWLTDLLVDLAPRIPLRDLPTLRAQHHGLEGDDLAEALVAGAAKATAAVGAAGGALAAVELVAPPLLLTLPAQLAAETLLVALIEIKLIAELHAVYGRAVTGSARERAAAYLTSWTTRRGIDPFDLQQSVRLAPGPLAKRALRKRLVRRAGRNLTTFGPLLSGAVAGSVVNHRESRRLGDEIRADLRG